MACAALGGYGEGDSDTPVNEAARNIFKQLLTAYIADQLKNENPHEVSKSSI